jgi:hypothetical protein
MDARPTRARHRADLRASPDGATGIYVLRVPSLEDAAALTATDPLVGDGVRVEVIEWDVHQILGIGSFAPPSVRDGDVG